jgi:peptide/nickel transport system substrate-binding protein
VDLRIVLVLVLALGASCKRDAPAKQPAAEPERKRLVIGITQEPDTLFLPFKAMRASELIGKTGTYSLAAYDEKWRLIPWAAKQLPTLDNGGVELIEAGGAQKMRVTWHLRDEFGWPDGRPLSADDFVFTFEMSKDERLPIPDRSGINRIEKMESRDEGRTLVVTWKEPYAYYASYDAHLAMPKHVVEPLYRDNPARLHESSFGQRPLLAGAFTIAEWQPGSHVVARRNPRARGFLAPKLDEIVWKVVPQTQALESHLLSGSVDVVSPIGFNFDQAIAFEERHGDRFDVHFTPALFWEHIDLNHDHPALKDRRVRRALLHGVDREQLVQELFKGKQPVAHATIPPGVGFHAPDVRRYPFDPARARALLDEAGFAQASDGVRARGDVRLSFTLMTTSGDRLREQVQQLLKDGWKAIGVEVTFKNQPARILFGETVRRRKYDSMVMFSWSMVPDTPNSDMWRCDRIPSADNGWNGRNLTGWCDEEATQLLDDAARAADRNKHDALIQRFDRIWAEELPSLPLYYRAEVSVTRKGLLGWRPTGTFQSVAWNAHEWAWAAP